MSDKNYLALGTNEIDQGVLFQLIESFKKASPINVRELSVAIVRRLIRNIDLYNMKSGEAK